MGSEMVDRMDVGGSCNSVFLPGGLTGLYAAPVILSAVLLVA